jgi:hypothetical protein
VHKSRPKPKGWPETGAGGAYADLSGRRALA